MDKNIDPYISVIMPVFNCSHYIEIAVNSILQQSFLNFEFIIIDDASTDQTFALLKKITDPRIILLKNVSNIGLVASLNLGIPLAKGRYIARMDGDDVSHPGRIARQMEFMDAHPEVGLCGTWVNLWNGERLVGQWQYPKSHEAIQANMFFKCSLAHPTVMLRTSLLQDLDKPLYQQEDFPAEDFAAWERLLPHTRMHNLQQPLLNYRLSSQQISNRHEVWQEQKTFDICWRQVLQLGFSISRPDKEIHKKFIQGPWVNNETDLLELKLWLNRLWNANTQTGYYDQALWGAMLAEKYWQICYSVQQNTGTGINLYFNNSFSKYFNPPKIQKFKILLRRIQNCF